MRRPAAVLAALALGVVAWPPARAGADPRADRAAVIARVAELTDRAEREQAAMVEAAARQSAAAGRLREARIRAADRAVNAYMFGLARTADAMTRPNVYLDLAFRADRRAMDDLGRARSDAARASSDAATARQGTNAALADLERTRAQLDAAVAEQDRRDAEAAARASAAAAKAAAAAEAQRAADARQAALTRPAAAGGTTHAAATGAQAGLMGRYPFGPVNGVPAGLRPTGQVVQGTASWYGPGFEGRPTASGAIYDSQGWTCASKELPLGTVLLVSANGRSVLLLVNDRGPYVDGWVLDLSHAAAQALGLSLGPVTAQVLAPA